MKIVQGKKLVHKEWEFDTLQSDVKNPLVLVFGNRYLLEDTNIFDEIRSFFPDGHLVFGSTSGEILQENVYDESITLTAVEFERSSYHIVSENVQNHGGNIESLGVSLVRKMPTKDLKHIFVVSEGSSVNGSELIHGMELELGDNVAITGGLCGDDARFEKTLASYNENPKAGEVVAVGLYGDDLEITCSNHGGWTAFGPERTITESKGNILYEIDGLPALDLYKKYLGEKAKELPQAALLYPLNVKLPDSEYSLVRTILNIDEKENTMILAGDVPVGSKVQLMMSTVDDIAEGASKAAKNAMGDRSSKPELALLVSCVGRKLVMDQRTEEEVEEVVEAIGLQAKVAGFYSYGEMAPFNGKNRSCQLHNQTMTLTLLSE